MINVLLHRVSIKPFDVDEWDEDRKQAKALGLALPDAEANGVRAKASVDMGTIVEIGPTAYPEFRDNMPVKVGDVVAFVKGAGKFVRHPQTKEELLIINDEDIVVTLTQKAD